jgi:hypothetical protein
MIGQPNEKAAESHIVISTTLATPVAANPMIEWRGMDSGIRKFRTFVAKSPTEMKDLWQKHAPGAAAPDVDFSQYMVVGVAAGQTRSGGSSIEVMGTRANTDNLTVYYREVTNVAGGSAALSSYTPYHFKVIPRTALPVEFQNL